MTEGSLYRLAFLLFNLIQWLIWYWTASRLFKPRLALHWVCIIETALTVLGIWLDAYPMAGNRLFGTMSFFLFFLLPMAALHEGKTVRKITLGFALLGTVMATEMIFSFLSPTWEMAVARREFYALGALYYYVEYLCCQFLLCTAVLLGLRVLEKRAGAYITDREKLLFLLFPVSQYVLLTGWYLNFVTNLNPSELAAALLMTAFCAVSDIFLYRLILRVADNVRLQARNELMQQQIDAKNEYYQLLAQSYGDMSRLRHDVANHIYTIQALLSDGNAADAMAYADTLRQSTAVKALQSPCRNTVVNAFLEHRLGELEAKGIRCDFDAALPAQCGVDDIDMIIGFGNLLDNAYEACAGEAEPFIRLRALLRDGFLHIKTENPCAEAVPPERKKRRIPYLERGIGTAILQSLAEKYNGTFRRECAGGTCHVTLVLKEVPTHENRDL